MAHHKATKKAIRQTEKRNARNTERRSRMATFIKKLEKAIGLGDKETAPALLKDAQSEIDRAVTKGVMKKKTAARKVSRLNAQVKNIDNVQAKEVAKKPASKAKPEAKKAAPAKKAEEAKPAAKKAEPKKEAAEKKPAAKKAPAKKPAAKKAPAKKTEEKK